MPPLETEDRFRKVVEHAPIAMAIVGMNGAIEYINRKAVAVFGYQPWDIPTMDRWWLQAYPDENYRRAASADWMARVQVALTENREIAGNEYRVTCKDGSLKTMFISGIPVTGKVFVMFDDITARKQAEEAVRRSEERYRCLVETTNTGYVIIDDRGCVLDANREYLRLSGHASLDEILGRNVLEWTAEEEKENNAKAVETCMKEGFVRNLEIAYIDISGRRTPVEINATIMELEGRRKILSLCRDITARKKAENTQKQTSSLLQATLESTADGLLVIDRSGKVTSYNNKFSSLWQIPRAILDTGDDEKLLAFILDQLENPDDFLAKVKELYAQPNQESFDHIEFKDGRVFERFSQPQKIDGEIAGRVWSFRDITERLKAEAELAANELKYRELSNTVPVGIYESDMEGYFTFVNTTGLEWFGYSETDMKAGLRFLNVIDPQDHERAAENSILAFRLPTPVPHEYNGRHKEGKIIPILISSQPLLRHGKPVGLRGIVLDLTEKKKIETLIQNAAKLDSLGILAGGIAHDFNNLLGGIFGYLELAGNTSQDAKTADYLSKALNTINRARGLTQQLLTFSKGGSPALKISALTPFLQETAQFALSGSNVSCRFDLSDNLWACNYDMTQIAQVIDNIVINAQQAMPEGGTIVILAKNAAFSKAEHPILDPGPYVRISVIDTGIGIPGDVLPRIFDPFFTTKPKGHGLGLATCYSIVKRHGGLIEVESEPGRGSAFHVFLPSTGSPAALEIREPAAAHKGTGRILVLDDEAFIRETLADMLQRFGYVPVVMQNGRVAADFIVQETLAKRRFAAAFLDLTIPGSIGGKDVVLEIRKVDREIPVFVISGYAEDPIMTNPAQFDFTASICKPFKATDIEGVLNRYV